MKTIKTIMSVLAIGLVLNMNAQSFSSMGSLNKKATGLYSDSTTLYVVGAFDTINGKKMLHNAQYGTSFDTISNTFTYLSGNTSNFNNVLKINGNLYYGNNADGLFEFNGTKWIAKVQQQAVMALEGYNGEICGVVGGVKKLLNNATWMSLGTAQGGTAIKSYNGSLYAAGQFGSSPNYYSLATFNGTNWSNNTNVNVTPNKNDHVYAIEMFNDLCFATNNGLYDKNTSTWVYSGHIVNSLRTFNKKLYFGANSKLYVYDGTSIDSIATFASGNVLYMTEHKGELIIAGDFKGLNGTINYIAKMNNITTGIVEHRKDAVNAYPNPFTNVINVIADGNVTVTNVNGQIVESINAKGNVQMCQDLAAGMYFIRSGNSVIKAIKQ